MRQTYAGLWMMCSLLFLCGCSRVEERRDSQESDHICVDEEENREIRLEHAKAWEEAGKFTFSDTDFLQTKQPMSDDAIAPYDYHTERVGDKAYNQVVYVKALERVKKHLVVEENKLVVPLCSGAPVYMAEDLFSYIVGVIDDWNR